MVAVLSSTISERKSLLHIMGMSQKYSIKVVLVLPEDETCPSLDFIAQLLSYGEIIPTPFFINFAEESWEIIIKKMNSSEIVQPNWLIAGNDVAKKLYLELEKLGESASFIGPSLEKIDDIRDFMFYNAAKFIFAFDKETFKSTYGKKCIINNVEANIFEVLQQAQTLSKPFYPVKSGEFQVEEWCTWTECKSLLMDNIAIPNDLSLVSSLAKTLQEDAARIKKRARQR